MEKCSPKYVQLLREQDFQIICFSFVRSYLTINNIISDQRQEEEEEEKTHDDEIREFGSAWTSTQW